MAEGIAIFGLNGGGKSTLAHALAQRMGYYEMDVEDYYFPEQKMSRMSALEKYSRDKPFGRSALFLPQNKRGSRGRPSGRQ